MEIYQELIPILDREEAAIEHFSLVDLEPAIIEKDRLVRRASVAEERRIAILKKICALISFDMRAGVPSLNQFRKIYNNYLENVKKLLSHDVVVELVKFQEDLNDTSIRFIGLFETITPRVRTNHLILKKLELNFSRSLAIFESGRNYDETGNTKSKLVPRASTTLRVRA